MSILQDYDEIRKDLGEEVWSAIDLYLTDINYGKREPSINDQNKDGYLFLDDILYKKAEYKKFKKWYYSKKIKDIYIEKFGIKKCLQKLEAGFSDKDFLMELLELDKTNKNKDKGER